MLNNRIYNLNSDSSEDEIVQLIDYLKDTGESFNKSLLVQLLSERHPIYKERGSISSLRLRGYLIEAFHHIGLPQKALPYILEELETSFYPYIVTASAKAIRGLKNPHPGIASFLNKSIYNIWQGDAISNFSSYKHPFKNQKEDTTALKEIFKSICWLGPKAHYILNDLYHLQENLFGYLNEDNQKLLNECIDNLEKFDALPDDCCTIPTELYTQKDQDIDANTAINLNDLNLQDQDGNEIKWGEYFHGKYTVLSFFYTQCHNPRKCIQTIYNLVDIQSILKKSPDLTEVQTAAVTYDPKQDTSKVLKEYGNNRKFQFTAANRMFRVSNDMENLIDALGIEINYRGDTVNVHRIEVYIINPKGQVEKSFLRFQAKPEFIIDELKKSISNGEQQKKKSLKVKPSLMSRFSTVVLPVLIAFFPKCPMCWAAYLNLIGISGIVTIPHIPWLIYVFIGLASLNFYNLYRLGKKRNGFTPLALASIGTFFLAINYWYNVGTPLIVVGILFTMSATLLNSLSFQNYHKLMHSLQEQWLSLRFKWS